ncbi:MAG: BamA/TamA family outer membrane protein [Phycisphaerales bacterium]|nr:BamA/TamA family outer membrane protein [Phycisphaerales bacterium]
MRWTRVAILLSVITLLGAMVPAWPVGAQVSDDRYADFVDRPISEVRITGLRRVTEQEVRNQLRVAAGDPFDPAAVRADQARLERLGDFGVIRPEAELRPDGTVLLVYTLVEQPIIRLIQVVGNSLVSDQELRGQAPFEGVPRNDYLIEKAIRGMESAYREKGHFLVTIDVDESELESAGVLIFRVVEGPRVRVKSIQFEGNQAFTHKQLYAEVKTRTSIPFLRKGKLDEDVLLEDVARIDRFYKDRGYLDVRVYRRVELSPDGREAKVVFRIEDGRQYILRSAGAYRLTNDGRAPLRVFSDLQIAAMLDIKPGDVYSADRVRKSSNAVADAYRILGYLDVQVRTYQYRTGPDAVVDLEMEIDEGRASVTIVGLPRIDGNFLTKDKVIRREARFEPGRPFDGRELVLSKRRIERTRLVDDVRITVQDEDPDFPGERDVLIEVSERNTGAFNFGIAFGSDSGAFGDFSVNQDNFDIADWPENFNEYLRGRAFRGAGQKFNLSLQPGDRFSQYAISLTEPHFLESDFALRGRSFYQIRRYSDYDQQRLSGSVGVSRQFGDFWTIGVNARAERVELSDIDPTAPVDVFDSAGPDNLTSLAVSLVRTTADSFARPTKGSRVELGYDQIGALGGAYDFGAITGGYTMYVTLNEDFLGRRSVLKLSSRVGYLVDGDGAPVYEKFYMGGRDFRGFDYRTVSPKGIRNDNGQLGTDPIGGSWMFFLGAQYEVPIFQEAINGVVFIDSGTVTDDIGFDDYRVSAGFGIRLYIPAFGDAPLAFDFGFPIRKEDGDDTQLFSFSIELPFR